MKSRNLLFSLNSKQTKLFPFFLIEKWILLALILIIFNYFKMNYRPMIILGQI